MIELAARGSTYYIRIQHKRATLHTKEVNKIKNKHGKKTEKAEDLRLH